MPLMRKCVHSPDPRGWHQYVRCLTSQIIISFLVHLPREVNPDIVPSESGDRTMLRQSFRDDFHMCEAQPLKEPHSDIWPKSSAGVLKNERICNISSHFIFKLNQTGFGASKSSLRRSLCRIRSSRLPFSRKKADLHFMTALDAVLADGEMLAVELITKLETKHSDFVPWSYIPNRPIYATPKV
jgi:hypothetical protein